MSDENATDLLLVKRRRVELMAAKNAALRNDALPFYRPHPKQDLFHRSLAKRRGAFTGNRFGKSHMGAAEDCAWLRGERPWVPKTDPHRTAGIPQRPVKGLIIVNDWDKAKEIWSGDDGKLWQFLPRGVSIKTSRNHSGAIDTLVYPGPFGPSTLRFDTVKSFSSNPQGSESSDWDYIHVDEPCPEAMFKAQARGLVDRGGAAWFTLTALKEPWITDAFDSDGVFAGISFAIDGSIYDNIYLTAENIADYERTLTPDEKDCRLYGKPLHKAGLVYKQFQRDKHVLTTLPKGWRSWTEPPPEWSHFYYIDPHARVPHTVLFLVVDPFNRLYFYHDIFERCLIREVCAQMNDVLQRDHKGQPLTGHIPRNIIRGRVDPIAYIEDQLNGSCWAHEFANYGFPVEKAVKDPIHGISRVQELLSADPTQIFFTPSARRTIWEIQRFHWDDETNKPVDVDDHAMECLYRAVLDEPRYSDPAAFNRPIEDIVIDHSPRLDLEDLETSLAT